MATSLNSLTGIVVFAALISACTQSKSPETPKAASPSPATTPTPANSNSGPTTTTNNCSSTTVASNASADDSASNSTASNSDTSASSNASSNTNTNTSSKTNTTTSNANCSTDTSGTTTTVASTELNYSSLLNPPELAACNGDGLVYNFGFNVEGYASNGIKCVTDVKWDKSICKDQATLIKAFGTSGSALQKELGASLKGYELTEQCGYKTIGTAKKAFATFILKGKADGLAKIEFKQVVGS